MISIDLWFVMIGQYLKIWNLRVHKKLNIEKIIIKVVISKVLLNIFMEHALNDFWHEIKMIILSHTCIVGYCYKYTCAPGSVLKVQSPKNENDPMFYSLSRHPRCI